MKKRILIVLLSIVSLIAVCIIASFLPEKESMSFKYGTINYDSRHSSPIVLKTEKSYRFEKPSCREIKISFKMKVNSVSDFNNIFQTAPGNSGIRMELGGSAEKSLGMVIGEKSVGLKGFLITNNLSLGKWHDVFAHITRDKRIMIYLDNVLAVDEVCKAINYDLSDIVIGTGFSRTRPFDGEIRDFGINCKSFYKPFSWAVCLLLQLSSGAFFIFSLFLVRDKVAVYLRLLKTKASITYLGAVSCYKKFNVKKYIAHTFLFLLPVLLIAFSAVKIFTYPHFTDLIKPDTLKYIGAFSLGFIVLIALLDRCKKSLFIILVPFLLIIIAGQTYALFALALYIFASLALGLFLWRLFLSAELNLVKIGYAVFVGLVVNSYVIWGALHFKVNYSLVYYLFLSAQIIILWKTLFTSLRGVIRKMHAYQLTPAQKTLVFLMTVHVVYVLVPTYLWDDLVAHFYIPKVVSLYGLFNFSPHYVPAFFNLSFVSMGSNSVLFLAGGEFAIRLFYWAILYMSFFLFESFTRHEYEKRASLFATLTLATTPYFLWIIGCVHIDSLALFSAVILFINIMFLMKNFTPRNIFIFILLAGFSVFFKLQIVFLLIPAVFIVCFRVICVAYRQGNLKPLKAFLFGCLFAFIFILPILLHNWIITKNPVFPMYNDLIKSPFYDIKKPLPGFFKFIGAKLQWDSLYDITFAGDKYYVGGNNRFLFGVSYFIFLWFIPILFFCREHKRQLVLTLGLFGSSVFLCYFITGPVMRYFITSAPMGAIIIGFLMDKLLFANSVSKFKFYILYAAFISVFIINFICQINISIFLPSPYPLKEAITKNYSNSPRLKYWQDRKNFFEEANRRYDRNTKALLFYSPDMYFADFKIEVLDWYNQLTVMEIFRKYNTIDELYCRIFNEQKFDILIITDKRPATFLDELIKSGMVKKDYSAAGYGVYLPLKKH